MRAAVAQDQRRLKVEHVEKIHFRAEFQRPHGFARVRYRLQSF